MQRNTPKKFQWSTTISVHTPSAGDLAAGENPGTYAPGLDYSASDNVSKYGQIFYGILADFDHEIDEAKGGFPEMDLDRINLVLVDSTGAEINRCDVYTLSQTPVKVPGAYYEFSSSTPEISPPTSLSKGYQLYAVLTPPTVGGKNWLSVPWNAMIQPRMKAVGYKDGVAVIETNPELIKYDDGSGSKDMKIASKARISVDLQDNNVQGSYILVEQDGIKGINFTFDVAITLLDATNPAHSPCHRASDYPQFSTIDLDYQLTSNFVTRSTIQVLGVKSNLGRYNNIIASVDQNKVLNIHADRVSIQDSGIDRLTVSLFVPVSAGLDPDTVTGYKMKVEPEASNPLTIGQFGNRRIFEVTNNGVIERSIRLANTENTKIVEWINQPNETTIEQPLELIGDDLYIGAGTKMMVILEEKLRYFDPVNLIPSITYTDEATGNTVKPDLKPLVDIKYGYVDFTTSGYLVEAVANSVLNDTGLVELYTPLEAANASYLYNILVFEFSGNPHPQEIGKLYRKLDYLAKLSNIAYCTSSQFKKAYGISFKEWYDNQTGSLTTGKAHSYMKLNTIYKDKATAEANYAGKLATVDRFVETDGVVTLKLGSTNVNDGKVLRLGQENKTTYRFGVPNFDVRLALNIVEEYSVGKFAYVDQVIDYNKVYYLALENKSQGLTFNEIVIPGRNNPNAPDIVIQLDKALHQHLFDVGIYYLYRPETGLDRAKPKSYEVDFDDQITISLFDDLVLEENAGIYIPVKFCVNNQEDLVVNKTFAIKPDDATGVKVLIGDGVAEGMDDTTQHVRLNYINEQTGLSLSTADYIGYAASPARYYPLGEPTPSNRDNYLYGANIINGSGADQEIILAIPVPTDEYNLSKNSNNTMEAAITGIRWSITPDKYYYLTDSADPAVKELAKQQMQRLNNSGNTLKDFIATPPSGWAEETPADGDGVAAPIYLGGKAADIAILILHYTTARRPLPKEEHLRIYFTLDYKDIPYVDAPYKLKNNGVIQFNNGIVEAKSNEVVVTRDLLAEPPVPMMTVAQAQQYKLANSPLDYTVNFVVPSNLTHYDHIYVDMPQQLHTVLMQNSLAIYDQDDQPLVKGTDYIVTQEFAEAGKQIALRFAIAKAVLEDYKEQTLTIRFTRILSMGIHELSEVIDTKSQALLSVISGAVAIYTVESLEAITTLEAFNDVELVKVFASDRVYRKAGEEIQFSFTFILPSVDKGYVELTVADELPPSLTYVSSTLDYVDEAEPGANSGRDISYRLLNIAKHPGAEVTVSVVAKIADTSAIEVSRVGVNDVYYIDNDANFQLVKADNRVIGPVYSNVARVFAVEPCVVNVYHIDQETKDILLVESVKGASGEGYEMASSDLIPSYYQLMETIGDTVGVFSEEPQVVTFYYIKVPVSMTCDLVSGDESGILLRANNQSLIATANFKVPNYDEVDAIKVRYLVADYAVVDVADVTVKVAGKTVTVAPTLTDAIVYSGEANEDVRMKQVEFELPNVGNNRGEVVVVTMPFIIADATQVYYRVVNGEKVHYVHTIAQLEFNGDETEGPTCYREALTVEKPRLILYQVDDNKDEPINVGIPFGMVVFEGIPGEKKIITGAEPELALDGFSYLGFAEDGSIPEKMFTFTLDGDVTDVVYYEAVRSFTLEANVDRIMHRVGEVIEYTAKFTLPADFVDGEEVIFTDTIPTFLALTDANDQLIAPTTINGIKMTTGVGPDGVELAVSNNAITYTIPRSAKHDASHSIEIVYSVMVESLVGIPYAYVENKQVFYIANNAQKTLPNNTVEVSEPLSMVYLLEPSSVTVDFVDFDTNKKIAKSITQFGLVGEVYDLDVIVDPNPVDLDNYDEYDIPVEKLGKFDYENHVYIYYYKKKDIKLILRGEPALIARIDNQQILYTAEFRTPAEVYEVDALEVELLLDKHISAVQQIIEVPGATRKPLAANRVGYSLSNLAATDPNPGVFNKPVVMTVLVQVDDASLIGARENEFGVVEYFIETSVVVTFGNYRFEESIDVLVEDPGMVYIQYVDEDTRELIKDQDVLSGKVGTAYKVPTAPDIAGYSYTSASGNTTGTFEEEPNSVFYYYEKVGTALTVTSVPQEVNRLVGEEFDIVLSFDLPHPVWNYDELTVSSQIPDYLDVGNTLPEDVVNADSTVTITNLTVGNLVTYKLEGFGSATNPEVTVTIPVAINNIDKIPMLKDGAQESYHIDLKGVILFPDGREVSDDHLVDVVDPARVIQYYMDDKSGKHIHEPKQILGKVGQSYNAINDPVVEVVGYRFSHSTKNTIGSFTTNTISVVHYYEKEPITINKMAVEDSVVLLNGEEINFVISLLTPAYSNVDSYNTLTVIDEIPSYLELVNANIIAGDLMTTDNSDYPNNRVEYVVNGLNQPENAGKLVTIRVKTKISNSSGIATKEVFHVDANGAAHIDNMTTAVFSDKVIVESTNVIVKTTPAARVVVEYQLFDGEQVVIRPADVLESKIGAAYDTVPVAEAGMKNLEGFELMETPANAKGVFTKDEIRVVYHYKYTL